MYATRRRFSFHIPPQTNSLLGHDEMFCFIYISVFLFVPYHDMALSWTSYPLLAGLDLGSICFRIVLVCFYVWIYGVKSGYMLV